MTEKLYYSDPTIREFAARALSVEPRASQWAVVLDRTAFYAEGGGQLYDTGTLSDGQAMARVLNVQDERGSHIHLLDRALALGDVRGSVDADRRWDLTQQHTGQHILSQALFKASGIETVSVHMTAENCTLDLARHANPDQQARAEEIANTIVQENRPVSARFVDDETLSRLPLRKPPAAKHERVRIVEVADFDWSACGGTHVRVTGEVGLIKLVRAEKRGAEQRIEFACGMRAVRDYRWKNTALLALASQFTVKDSELAEKVQSLAEENKELRRQQNFLRAELANHEADRLWQAASDAGANGLTLVSRVFSDRTADQARLLAQRLKEKPATVALLAVAGEKPALIFARSADAAGNMGALLREVSAAFGGRGGGQPEMAQGGVAAGSDLHAVLALAAERWRGAGG